MHATLAGLGTIFQASPVLCTCEPRRPCGEMQAVPCGARSDTRLLTASGSQPRSGQIRSVRAYHTRRYLYFGDKTIVTFFGHVELSARKGVPAHPDAFARASTSAGPRSGRAPNFPCLHPCPRTHGEIRGRNAPGRRARDSYTRRK